MHSKSMIDPSAFIHPDAKVSPDCSIGANTKIWGGAQILDGVSIGNDCSISGGCFIETGAIIGSRVTIKNNVLIWNGVSIADDVFIGPGVTFTNDLHPRSPRMDLVKERYAKAENWLEKTTVENGVSIGASSTILCNLSIGAYASIGAGSLVTKSIRPHILALGHPCKEIGHVCKCGQRIQNQECEQCYFKL